MVFLSADKKAEIRAFGRLAIEDFDRLDQEFESATGQLKLIYKHITKDWFVVSGINEKGNIVYCKTRKKIIDYMG